ncbi:MULTISPECIES: hypothetical protein [unclassified Sphingobium]|uniref:hypothetical protein n=1 Tax=unclassified Sphingobium TaxID=2611147 RepID=UPI002224F3A8|nr:MULTISPECIES: hypothetical protein [unclassified Sphingobium]MCW2412721.1 hypothetical protein [Sphingobium sp. B8D3D]MCW2414981.1 hypothetical protein [Sphingobium sp. B8D3A]
MLDALEGLSDLDPVNTLPVTIAAWAPSAEKRSSSRIRCAISRVSRSFLDQNRILRSQDQPDRNWLIDAISSICDVANVESLLDTMRQSHPSPRLAVNADVLAVKLTQP